MKQGRSQRDVMNYSPPQGPKNITDPKGPSIHGDVCKDGLDQDDSGPWQSSGRAGLGGRNNCCSQGKY